MKKMSGAEQQDNDPSQNSGVPETLKVSLH